MRKAFIFPFMLMLAVTTSLAVLAEPRSLNQVLRSMDLAGVDNLMLVAHPDDESLWGGTELIENNYLVVCMTNRRNKTREKEFSNAMRFANVKYLMLDHLDGPEKFEKCERSVEKDLHTVLAHKKWNKIVTHNPTGEYGHLNHKTVNRIVTKLSLGLGIYENLHYFIYHTKDEINLTPTMNDELYNKKLELLKVYASQQRVINKYLHHLKYEGIVLASMW